MLNEEDYISFDTAKMLKNKGFDEFCRYTYMENENSVGITVSTNSKLPKEVYSMPTLWEAQKYLRETHKIHIVVDFNKSGWYYRLYDMVENELIEESYLRYKSFELALEAGIHDTIQKYI